MKNNRLTNAEIHVLSECVERIRELASMENASFSGNEEEDKKIKESVRPYMLWFTNVASKIELILKDEYFNCY